MKQQLNNVPIRTTGSEKQQIIVSLAGKGDGSEMKPLVVRLEKKVNQKFQRQKVW